jgi:hypothetical protein
MLLSFRYPVAFTFGRLSPNLHFRTVFTKKKNKIFTVWKTFHDLDLDSHTCAFFPLPLPKENFTVSLLLV